MSVDHPLVGPDPSTLPISPVASARNPSGSAIYRPGDQNAPNLSNALSDVARRLHSALLEFSSFVRQVELEVDRALPGRHCQLITQVGGRGRQGMPAGDRAEVGAWAEDFAFTETKADGACDLVAIHHAGRAIGRLAVWGPGGPVLSDAERNDLRVFADHLGPLLGVAIRYAMAVRDADSDGLTGLANHRAFYRTLSKELDRRAGSAPTSVVLFDIDGLKQINDLQGHLAGDAMLRQFARMLEANMRRHDLVARYGGDEFAVVMPQTSAEQAWSIGSRIRRSLRKRSLTSPLLRPAAVSFGVATAPRDGMGAAELVAVADRRLYATRGRRPSP